MFDVERWSGAGQPPVCMPSVLSRKRHTVHESTAPSPFLVEQSAWLPSRGDALDVACGSGRNAIYLAQRGLFVCALDRDAEALANGEGHARELGLSIEWVEQELEQGWRPEPGSWDVILVNRFLFRSLLPALVEALRPGGRLFYSTFTIEQRAFGRPHREDFLLRPNELLHAFRDLRVRHYFEGVRGEGADRAAVAEIVAERSESS